MQIEVQYGIETVKLDTISLGIQSPKLKMVMEPKYYAEKVIGHPNHQLRI